MYIINSTSRHQVEVVVLSVALLLAVAEITNVTS